MSEPDSQSTRESRGPSRGPLLLLWGVALVALLLGAALTVDWVRHLPRLTTRLQRKADDLAALSALSASLAPYESARAAFERLGTARPARLPDVLAQALGGAFPGDVRIVGNDELSGGWRLRTVELSFAALPPAAVVKLARAAEGGRPPWRMRRCVLKPGSAAEGAARAVLVFEALEKDGG